MAEENGKNGNVVEVVGAGATEQQRRGDRQTDEDVAGDGHRGDGQHETVTTESAL